MEEKRPARTKLEEDVRIDSLQQRIDDAQREELGRSGRKDAHGVDNNYQLGSRVLSYLVGGIGGGGLIGWTLDRLIGTSPWLLLLCLFLGIGVAFRNVYRIATRK
ncbi:MAG: AtpZ/AtpI family protein [Novosphingopyxis baekryungensis]|jgi:ATP synthase protein I|uniref:AtpZ/AtpI family protein n=1 Tax=Novosphingopyxis baekryungensis TaxID=279369 RepID=UPI0003B5AF7B|nr:AtpZ/AtpI family protein [Novosphingopyxis baekryungensis]MDE0932173.1 AtpZ/AtpI family protein [Novosphingopyxis baekryungensis]